MTHTVVSDAVRRNRSGEDGWLRLASRSVQIRSDLPLAILDCAVVIAAYSLVLALRFDGAVPPRYAQGFALFLPTAVVIHVMSNWTWGLYGQMWRHASVQEARRVVLSGMTALFALLLLFVWARVAPLSVVGLGASTATMMIGAVRFQSRLFAFRRTTGGSDARRVVVLGAGETGAVLVRDMLRMPEMQMRPVAVLDDDPRKQGRGLHGITIGGGLRSIADVAHKVGAQEALLAIPSADSELVREVANAADRAGLTLKVLPRVSELVNGQVSVRDARDVRIDDLLGRAQVQTDLDAVRSILEGRRVLITGAGGSIGSEIARQVAACNPANLVLLDHDETHLHDVVAEVDGRCTDWLCDIRDADDLQRGFSALRPEVVFHAAAHKHVPVLERYACHAIRTNIVGTRNVADAAVRHGVDRLVMISTDKAVRPSSVMGASKRIAEQTVLSRGSAGRFCAVRFGNVLGSRGSVVPRFVSQIQKGRPVTVTHAEMTRFFMSIPEAVQLVLQASVFAEGGEVFMLDMGEPVKIIDLAHRMIRLSGRRVGTDVPVRITGIRPGEKLAEELYVPDFEIPEPTDHASVVKLRPPLMDRRVLDGHLERLRSIAEQHDDAAAAEQIRVVAGASVPTEDRPELAVQTQKEEEPWRRASIG